MRYEASRAAFGAVLLLGLAAACDRGAPASVRRARPVTVLTLETLSPARTATLTGSAEPYRQEELGFEVSGRITHIVGVGTAGEGGYTDPQGRPLGDGGTLLARLDPTRYQLRVQALEAGLESARRAVRAQEIEVSDVATADLEAAKREVDAAEAAVTLARTNLDKARQLVARGAGTGQDVDNARKDFDQAVARLEQAKAARAAKEATIALKGAQLEAARAQVAELEQNLEAARRDLADCELRAPFSGRVTALHVARGAVVAAGQPALTLTLMDPIKVSVAVSADTDRALRLYDRAEVHVRDALDPERTHTLFGVVLDKGEVGDPATRTFRIDVLLRNEPVTQVPDAPGVAGAPRVHEVLPAILGADGETLFVEAGTLARDEGGAYVLALDAPPMGSGAPIARGVLGVRKIRVVPGGVHWAVARWDFRSLEEAGELSNGVPLIVVPRGVARPDEVYAGGVVVAGRTWRIRPGDLARVVFDVEKLPPGLYAPMRAIRERNGEHAVFVVVDGTATRVPVSVHESFHERRRIEGAGVEPGVRIAVEGAHYLGDGDAVDVIGAETPR